LQQHDKLNVFAGGQHGDQVEGLEHKADVFQAVVDQLVGAQVSDHRFIDHHLAGARLVQSADQVEQGRLPGTGRAHQGRELPSRNLQVHVVDRMHGNGVRVVGLAEVVDLDDECFHIYGAFCQVNGAIFISMFSNYFISRRCYAEYF
jgi:hypothetical protein